VQLKLTGVAAQQNPADRPQPAPPGLQRSNLYMVAEAHIWQPPHAVPKL